MEGAPADCFLPQHLPSHPFFSTDVEKMMMYSVTPGRLQLPARKIP